MSGYLRLHGMNIRSVNAGVLLARDQILRKQRKLAQFSSDLLHLMHANASISKATFDKSSQTVTEL